MRWQFSRIGNNYNQIVKQMNAHFSEQAAPVQLSILIGYTRQLKTLSLQIIALSEKLQDLWLPK
ncbi:hypothetical protein K060079A122_02260 [Alistipes onderdonkii]|jgi:hypothetical protein|nr:plasmid mobilization relaxosome protein MobC [Alistipes onderdonkii]